MRMLDDDDGSNDVEVSWSDQQKINQFSRLNQRQTDAQAALDTLRQEKEQLDEVFEEVQMMEMTEDFDEDLGEDDDDDDLDEQSGKKTETKSHLIPFKIGDAFVHVTLEKATAMLEQEQARVEKEIADAEEKVRTCDGEMKGLKVDLYAKFGSNINLERD